MKDLNMDGAPKMLRKTFSSIAKIELGTTSKARALTGHEQDPTLDIHYDKLAEPAKEYAHQVAKLFNLIRFQMSKSLDPNVPGPSKAFSQYDLAPITDRCINCEESKKIIGTITLGNKTVLYVLSVFKSYQSEIQVLPKDLLV